MPSTTDGTAGFGRGKRKRRKRANVIHVAFGAGGGRVPGGRVDGAASTATAPPPDEREPVTDLFTRSEVGKLLGLSSARLRSLDRA
jgi:hypothetical protein